MAKRGVMVFESTPEWGDVEVPSAAAVNERLSVKAAAAFLGVSARLVYDLAAPGGPIPCYRIGGRVVFDRADLEAYLQSCRVTQAPRAPLPRLSSTSVLSLRDDASELRAFFEKRGLKPKLKPSEPRTCFEKRGLEPKLRPSELKKLKQR